MSAPEIYDTSEGKGKMGSIAGFVLIHIFLHGSVIVSIFALATLNLELITAITILVLVQSRLRKNKQFADYIAKRMHPANAFNSFKIIDDHVDPQIPDSKQKVIYGFHPHGVYALGFLAALNQSSDPHFSSVTGLASSFILNLPILGAILRMWGIEPASNQQVKTLMQQGKTMAILPGGFQEATVTSPNEFRCWIKERKGFIKYAIQYNYAIRPVLITKEHQGFWTLEAFEKLRLYLNRFKIPGVVFWNKIWGFILPISLDITILKGRPVNLPAETLSNSQAQPSQQLIDKIHMEYIAQIQRLYQKYQSLNGGKPLKLY